MYLKIIHLSPIKRVVIPGLLFFALLAACSDSGTDPADQVFLLPDSNLTYFDDIRPMFVAKCGSRSGCHSSSDLAGGLDITSYAALIAHNVNTSLGSERLILGGDGNSSFLYRILLSNYLERPRMPIDGPPFLNTNNSEGVRIWIDEGAPPN